MNLLNKRFDSPDFRKKWLSITAIIFAICLAIIIGLSVGSILAYQNKFFPNTKIGTISVGNRTPAQAQELINRAAKNLIENGIQIKTQDGQTVTTINSVLASTDPDLARNLFSIDTETTINKAWKEQHQVFSFTYFITCLSKTFTGWRFTAEATVNDLDITDALKNTLTTVTTSSKPTTINFSSSTPTIVAGSAGTMIDYNFYTALVTEQIKNLSSQSITVNSQPAPEPITADLISSDLQNNIDTLASNTPAIIVKHEDKSWTLPFVAYRNWLEITKDENNRIAITLNQQLATPFWEEIKGDIDRPVQDARFSIVAGRVKEFKASSDGQRFNVEDTLKLINEQLNTVAPQPVTAVVTTEKSTVGNDQVNDLGVDEIIGIGQSNFKGSPKNRRHNIATGAKAITGLLIAPGEDFSLIKALGTIDGSTGYLQELVIKGNQTKPEYGGGLCQIGTTVFRATLASGLPILERRNHSYRVAYYEPAGTDATIYDPKPDFRFKNDTGHHILIQTRISGDDLFVEFWGTKDGRNIEQSKPTVYNIVSPGAPQMIESDSLKPGEVKCIETPHAGADAFFDYKVTYPSGEEKSERFTSHYVPWTKKCLVGKTASSTPTGTGATNETTNTSPSPIPSTINSTSTVQ